MHWPYSADMDAGRGRVFSRAGGSALGAIIAFACLVLSTKTAADVVLTAKEYIVPWKATGEVFNQAAELSFERFLSQNPGVRIVEFDPLRLPGQQEGAGQVMNLAGLAGPDILQVSFDELADYAREGLVQAIDDLYEDFEEKERWPATVAESLSLEGLKWGVVEWVDFGILAGSREAFKARGLAEESMPKTLDELVEIATKLAVPGKRFGVGLVEGDSLVRLWLAMAAGEGGEKVLIATKDGIEANLVSPSSRRAAEIIADLGAKLRNAGPNVLLMSLTWPGGLQDKFREGKVALALLTSPDLGQGSPGKSSLQGAEPLLSPVPGIEEGRPLNYVTGGSALAIPGFIRDPYRRGLIWRFFVNCRPAVRQFDLDWLEVAGKKKMGIPLVFTARYPDHPLVKAMPAHWGAASAAALEGAVLAPPGGEWQELSKILNKKLVPLFEKGGDPFAALQEAQKEFDEGVHNKSRHESAGWAVFGWGLLVCFGIVLVVGLLRLVLDLRGEVREMGNGAAAKVGMKRMGFVLGLFSPAVLISFIFGVFPLLIGLRISMYDHVLKEGGAFVGMENFFNVVVSSLTHLAVANTLIFMIYSFFLGFLAPLALALVIVNFPMIRTLVRTAFFLPAVASIVVVTILWQQMFAAPSGPFNQLMVLLGYNARDWLKDPSVAMFAVVLPQAWATLGVSGLVFMAGLTAIPEELYEDAEIAGAGIVERFISVTFPYMRPLIGITLVGWLISATRVAEQVFLLTGGGPEKATYVLGLDIFNQAYVYIQFGHAMAEVWLLVAIILIFSIFQIRAIRSGQVRVRTR